MTSFSLHHSKRMPMTLCKASGAVQSLTELVLTGLIYKYVLGFVVDNIFNGRSVSLATALDRKEEANSNIHCPNCKLFQSSIHFRGISFFKKGIKIDPAKPQLIIQPYPSQKKMKLARVFLDLTGFLQFLIPNFEKRRVLCTI